MMRRCALLLLSLFGVTGVAAACTVGSDCDFGLCVGPPAVSSEGGVSDVDSNAPPVSTPPGCDPAGEQRSQPACLNDEFAVFVAQHGAPEGAGTLNNPVSTVTRAIALAQGKRQRIFVCEGTYDERIVLKTRVSIYGGLSCATSPWKPTDNATIIGSSQEAGYAVDVQNVNGKFDISDIEFRASSGNEAFPNSIAARFTKSPGGVLKNVKLVAKDGSPGKAGETGAAGSTFSHTDVNGVGPFSPKGADVTTAGVAGGSKACLCPNAPSEITSGGAGGSAGTGSGSKGEPSTIPATGAGGAENGNGGLGNRADCSDGGSGRRGASRAQAAGGAVSTRQGALDENGDWRPERGGSGAVGLPGQGGGGGGGRTRMGTLGAGSGGGCGGCGGAGGVGGAGGGASIALLTINSPIRIIGGELVMGKGGTGGDGGEGGAGGEGGLAGNVAAGPGCQGGEGGTGGRGGGGGGGVGGIAVGILFHGDRPPVDNLKFTPFAQDAAGQGGKGKAGNDGPRGFVAETASADSLAKGEN